MSNDNATENLSIWVPLTYVAVAFVVSGAISIFSLGILTPIGALIILISIFLLGFWVLLNRKSKWSRVAAVFLIIIPIVAILNAILEVANHF